MVLEENAFSSCYQLQSITIPENIEIIPKEIFYNCYSMNNVTMGNKILEIQEKLSKKKISRKDVKEKEQRF